MEPMILMKGFLIGASMLIPGVSGGTMAMIFGIYDRLISSISSFMKHKKESALFLLQFVIGGSGVSDPGRPYGGSEHEFSPGNGIFRDRSDRRRHSCHL